MLLIWVLLHCKKMKFSIKDFFSNSNQKPQFPADLITFIACQSLMETFIFCAVLSLSYIKNWPFTQSAFYCDLSQILFNFECSLQNLIVESSPCNRSSHWRCSVKNDLQKKFANFSGKDLCRSVFLTKLVGLQARCFPVKFAKFLKNIYFNEHLRKTASVVSTPTYALPLTWNDICMIFPCQSIVDNFTFF